MPVKGLLRPAISLVFWLGVWHLAAGQVDSLLLLPGPATVLERLGQLAMEPAFWATVAATLGRVLLGLAWGTALGTALAALTCLSGWADAILSPAIGMVRATPVASFILLVLLWTDRNQVPVLIAALMVLPVVWGSVSRGIRECDRKLLEMARAYRLSPLKTARLVVLPGVRPYFFSAVTTSMGLAWKSGVAAEVLCLPKLAMGTQIFNTKYYLETPDLFAWTLVVVALSLALEGLITLLFRDRKAGEPA